MHETLLGYLLAALEPHEHAKAEEMLQTFDDARHQLEVLRRALEPLEADDHKELQIPRELAVRTCQRVRELRISRASGLE